MELSYFENYSSRLPVSSTLEEVVEFIRSNERIRALTDGYRVSGDRALKEASPLFGVAAIFSGGKKAGDITSLTGLSLVDIDHVAAKGGVESLKMKVEKEPHTLLCYKTISGDGLRILFRYELDMSYSLAQQKQFYPKAFAVGNAYYARLLGIETDEKCKNIGRLSGLAYDPDVYLNLEAVPFTTAEMEATWQERVSRQRNDKKRQRERARLKTCYEQTIGPEVEAEGAVYAPGSHNDYVMRVGYKLNQFGFDEELAMAWAAETFADYDKAAEVIHCCYQRTEEHGTRSHSHLFREGREVRNEGSFASVQDIREFLSAHIQLRHNVITGRVEAKKMNFWSSECHESSLSNGRVVTKVNEVKIEKWNIEKWNIENNKSLGDEWQPITDRVVNSLWAEMSATQRVNVLDIYRVIESDFVPEFHPFKEYLERVKNERIKNKKLDNVELTIGGGSAIAALARTVTVKGDGEQQQLFEEYLRKWLVGMVAGWIGDDEVNHVILVLIGEQGSYKTTWFQYLLPPELRRYFYTKTNASRMGRDDLLTLAQYGLVCCEELDTMRPAELNQLKAAVTMPSIDERAAYAHFHEHRKHIASFCGTGNNTQFLSDPTGNRRWLPFEVESIRSPRKQPFDYDAIYGEAYSLYLSGFNYWFSREEIVRLSEHNHQFETPRLELELVQEYFRIPTEGESGEFLSVAMALQIVSANISQKLSPVHMGRAFRELGFEQKVIKNVRGYIVMRYTPQEMHARRVLAASIQ